jgi:hypothetical protein
MPAGRNAHEGLRGTLRLRAGRDAAPFSELARGPYGLCTPRRSVASLDPMSFDPRSRRPSGMAPPVAPASHTRRPAAEIFADGSRSTLTLCRFFSSEACL